jgi:DNA-directed RNA polymerase III subunit RPC1
LRGFLSPPRKCNTPHNLSYFSASIQFSLLRGSDIEKSSHVPVFDRILYNRDDNMTPLRNGPLDSRLGTNEKTANCSTCNQGVTDCPGHFGFIKLALPVFHVGYFKHAVSVLQVVCKSCSRVLLSEEDRAKHMKRVRNNLEPSMNLKVLKATIDDCRKMHTCIHCGAHNG